MLCEKCHPRELKAMRALESCTPGGSEFVNEVERCVSHIRDHERSALHFAKLNKAARTALESVSKLANEPWKTTDKAERFDEMQERMEALTLLLEVLKR